VGHPLPGLYPLLLCRSANHRIYHYITYTLEAPKAAYNLLDELEKSINDLKMFPLAHRLYRPIKPLTVEYRVLTSIIIAVIVW